MRVLAGPILRRMQPDRLTFWLATTEPVAIALTLYPQAGSETEAKIELRGHQRGPDLWQITSSGIKNEFPPRLLDVFDRLNR